MWSAIYMPNFSLLKGLYGKQCGNDQTVGIKMSRQTSAFAFLGLDLIVINALIYLAFVHPLLLDKHFRIF